MTLEMLEVGYLMVAERRAMAAMAGGLADDPQAADRAVLRSLQAVWSTRDEIGDGPDLVRRLYSQLREELSPPGLS